MNSKLLGMLAAVVVVVVAAASILFVSSNIRMVGEAIVYMDKLIFAS